MEATRMKAIILDDEPLMLDAFVRMTRNIEDLDIIGKFEYPEDVIEFSEQHSFEIAFLDIQLPGMNGIECAKILKSRMPELLVVFISAYDNYLGRSEQIGGVDYLIKPYNGEVIEKTIEKMRRLLCR